MEKLASSVQKFETSIVAAVHRAVAEEAERVRDEAIQDAVKAYEKHLRAAIGAIALKVSDYYSVTRMGSDIVVHVKLEDERKPNG